MDEQHEREKIGKVLSSLREEKGISKHAVSRSAGIKFEQIKSIEEGDGCTVNSLIKYLHAIRVKVEFSHIKSDVLDFVYLNKDQDKPIGDYCTDLLRDIEFGDFTTDRQRLSYIRDMGKCRCGDRVGDAIETFLEEYALYRDNIKKKKQEMK